MENLRAYQLIHKDLTDQLSSAEKLEIEKLKSNSEFKELHSQVESAWNASAEYIPQQQFDVNAAKARFKANLRKAENTTANQAKEQTVPKTQHIPSSSSPSWGKWIAIGLLLGLLAAGLLWYAQKQPATQEITNPTDKIEYAQLEDQTEIWLGPHSKLDKNSFINSEERKISLAGEAYFEVAQNTEKPFRIELTNNAILEVVGTAFNVIVDKQNESSQIDVSEGQVNVTYQDDTYKLTRGDRLVVTDKSATKTNHHQIYALKGNTLSFKNASLQEVFDEMELFYDINIEVMPQTNIANCRFSSLLASNYEAKELLQVIDESNTGLNIITESAKKYTITGKGCQ